MWALTRPTVRHVVALIAFIALLLLTIYFVATKTDAYEEAERFVHSDPRLLDTVGPVAEVHFRFWNGFQFTGCAANFSFEVVSQKGAFPVDVYLRCNAGRWRVESADIRSPDGQLKRIVGYSGGEYRIESLMVTVGRRSMRTMETECCGSKCWVSSARVSTGPFMRTA